MADSLFDQEEVFDENKDYLEELIGPGGKFDVAKYNNDRDVAIKAVAKGKVLGDRTIDQRNKEFDELREVWLQERAQSMAQAKFEELRLAMENQNDDTTITPVVNVEPTLDPNKLKGLVSQQLQEIEAERRKSENLTKVENRLKERFGDNAKSALKDKMNTLGLSYEDLKLFAQRSPEAVITALGLNQQPEPYQSPPRSSIRSDNFLPQTDIRDAVYYEKMRKEDPKTYFSEKTSVQRLKDMDAPEFLTRYNQRRT